MDPIAKERISYSRKKKKRGFSKVIRYSNAIQNKIIVERFGIEPLLYEVVGVSR
jgi:hypothetical protein